MTHPVPIQTLATRGGSPYDSNGNEGHWKMRYLTTAMALLLSGCAGTAFDWEKARAVQIGMTTEQVTGMLGQPYLVQTRPDGSTVWIWSAANGLVGSSQVVSYQMRDGRVIATPTIPMGL